MPTVYNFLPDYVAFKSETGEIVTYEPSPIFGLGGLKPYWHEFAKDRPFLDGVKVTHAGTWALPCTDGHGEFKDGDVWLISKETGEAIRNTSYEVLEYLTNGASIRFLVPSDPEGGYFRTAVSYKHA